MITARQIGQHRLSNQGIARPAIARPSDVVAWMGMVQAQDYLGALWAIGLRMRTAVEAEIEQALADRSIVRTWPARGTLHLTAAVDVRWMLELLAPRIIQRSTGRYRQLELDEATIGRSRDLLIHALQGGRQLSREAMLLVLETAHISTTGQRGIHILGRLALEGLICFGVREGKQQTFALLAEWVPQTKSMGREQALAELARRYFTSHGPATLQDFVWWSGLPTSEANLGRELAKSYLVPEGLGGQTYWVSSSTPPARKAAPAAYLLPAFDEYLVGYKVRTAVLDPLYVKQINAGGGILRPTIVFDGQVVGTWKRTLKKGSVVITPGWFITPKKAQERLFKLAALRYGAFLGLPVMFAGWRDIRSLIDIGCLACLLATSSGPPPPPYP